MPGPQTAPGSTRLSGPIPISTPPARPRAGRSLNLVPRGQRPGKRIWLSRTRGDEHTGSPEHPGWLGQREAPQRPPPRASTAALPDLAEQSGLALRAPPPLPAAAPHLCPRPAARCCAPRPGRWPSGWCLGPWQGWRGAGAFLALSLWSAAGRSLCRGCSACNPRGHADRRTRVSAAPRLRRSPASSHIPPIPRCCREGEGRGGPRFRKQDSEAYGGCPGLGDTQGTGDPGQL